MKKRLFLLFCLCALPACSSDEPENADSSRSSNPGNNPESGSPVSNTNGNRNGTPKISGKGNSGDPGGKLHNKEWNAIQLRDWPGLTPESAGQKVSPEAVEKILGVGHEVTAKKSSYSPEWKYSWKNPDSREKGHVSIEVQVNKSVTERMMKIQAGVLLNMTKDGRGKEIDLSKYGAVGVWRLKKKGFTPSLQICTRSQIVSINTSNMRGRDFDDEEAMMKAAEEISKVLFDGHSE